MPDQPVDRAEWGDRQPPLRELDIGFRRLQNMGGDPGSLLVAPAGTPNAIMQRLAAEVQRVNSLGEVKRFLAEQGAEPGSVGPEALAESIATEHARYGRIVRDTGIKVE